jgi:carbon monoxide dehydrogenase subunit G
MKIEGSHLFEGSREEVWNLFCDSEVINKLIGYSNGEEAQPKGKIKLNSFLKLDDVSGNVTGDLLKTSVIDSEKLAFEYDVRGEPGFMNGSGELCFKVVDAANTLVEYESDVNIGGAIASMDRKKTDDFFQSLLEKLFRGFDEALAAKISGVEWQGLKGNPPEEGTISRIQKLPEEIKLLMYIIPLVILMVLIAMLMKSCSA